MLEKHKVIAIREADYTRYRDFDDEDRQRRREERERYQARYQRQMIRSQLLSGGLH